MVLKRSSSRAATLVAVRDMSLMMHSTDDAMRHTDAPAPYQGEYNAMV